MAPQSIDRIFWDAAQIASPEEREAFLKSACGDDVELRRRVEQLLQARSKAEIVFESPLPNELNVPHESLKEEPAPSLDFLAPSQRPDSLGRLGHFEVLEVIGHGGMGIVLRAFDEKLHRVAAIKVMAAQLATNAAARKRFSREAHAAAAVSHDHIVTIHAVDEANGLPYLVMQYVSGMSLQQRLDREGPLQLTEIVRIGMQTASGLAAAHAQGLIHRDIKPANILLENGVERVKITDFGLARAAADASLTQSGAVAGTPRYMSPEQAQGETVDQRSDLFSLGSVLYAMCTGRAPFRASTSVAVLKRVCEETPTPIRESHPEIPDWLVTIIEKLLAKDPRERFQSAAEVADLLGKHLAAYQAKTELLNQTGESDLAMQGRGRRWTPVILGSLLLCIGVLGSWTIRGQRARDRLIHPVVQPLVSAKTDTRTDQRQPASSQPLPGPIQARQAAPRVLIVIASQDFWYSDLSVIVTELQDAGIRVVVASSTSSVARPLAAQPGEPVTPDISLSDANAADFDALIFCGGIGIEEYLGDSPAAESARNLVQQMLAADGYVGAISHAPAVLAEAGVLKGKPATCLKYEQRRYIKLLEAGGAVWLDEPVVVSGRIICGRSTKDAKTFAGVFLDHLRKRE